MKKTPQEIYLSTYISGVIKRSLVSNPTFEAVKISEEGLKKMEISIKNAQEEAKKRQGNYGTKITVLAQAEEILKTHVPNSSKKE